MGRTPSAATSKHFCSSAAIFANNARSKAQPRTSTAPSRMATGSVDKPRFKLTVSICSPASIATNNRLATAAVRIGAKPLGVITMSSSLDPKQEVMGATILA